MNQQATLETDTPAEITEATLTETATDIDEGESDGLAINLEGDDVELTDEDYALAFPPGSQQNDFDSPHYDEDEKRWGDTDEEEDPPLAWEWDDFVIHAGPADRQLYRDMTLERADGETITERIFCDRKNDFQLRYFLATSGKTLGLPYQFTKFTSDVRVPVRVVAEALQRAREADQAAVDHEPVPEIVGIPLASLAVAPPEREFLIDEFLPAYVLAALLAAFKGFKTWIGLSIAVAGITCKPLFGCFPVRRPFRTGYFLSEGGSIEAWERLQPICKAEGLDPATTRRDLVLYSQVPKLSTTAGLAQLRRIIQTEGFRDGLIEIDPWAFSTAGAATSVLSSMAGIYTDLMDMLNEEGVGLLGACHTTRGSAGKYGNLKPGNLADASGVGIAEFSRTWIVASYRRPHTLDGINELWLRVGGSAGAGYGGLYRLSIDQGSPGDRRWVATCRPDGDGSDQAASEGKAPQAAKPSRLKLDCRAILSAMRELPHGQGTARTLRASAKGMPVARFHRAINALISHGRAAECTVKAGKGKWPGFRLMGMQGNAKKVRKNASPS